MTRLSMELARLFCARLGVGARAMVLLVVEPSPATSFSSRPPPRCLIGAFKDPGVGNPDVLVVLGHMSVSSLRDTGQLKVNEVVN